MVSNLARELLHWMNSINTLDSDKLSSIGIDDIGDLKDECPVFKKWIDEFYQTIYKED